jgi:ABC-2 type transport system permease protein
VLVLDEPANGLDPQGIRWLRDFMRWYASQGRTVLVSSHVLAEMAQVADAGIVIARSRILAQGSIAELTAGRGGAVEVHSPGAERLAAALRARGYGVEPAGDAGLVVTGADAPAVGDLLLILGLVGTTGEYRHGTITSSLLGTPERRRLVASKLLGYTIAGALLGVAAIAAVFAVGVPWLSAREAPVELLGAGDYLELAARGTALAALSGALGVGIGAIVRNQVAAVVGTLVYLFMLEPVVGVISSELAAYTMGGAQTALGAGDLDDALDPLPAGLVLTGWVLLLGSLGALLEEQRDVT